MEKGQKIPNITNYINASKFFVVPEWLVHFNFSLLLVFAIFGCVGNGLVVIVNLKHRNKKSTNVLVLGVALFDFICSSITIPVFVLQTERDIWSSVSSTTLCKIHFFIIYTTTISTSLYLLAISVDQFIKICRPLSTFLTIREVTAFSFGVPLLAATLSTPMFEIVELRHSEIDCERKRNREHVWNAINGILVLAFLVMSIVTSVAYAKVAHRARQLFQKKLVSVLKRQAGGRLSISYDIPQNISIGNAKRVWRSMHRLRSNSALFKQDHCNAGNTERICQTSTDTNTNETCTIVRPIQKTTHHGKLCMKTHQTSFSLNDIFNAKEGCTYSASKRQEHVLRNSTTDEGQLPRTPFHDRLHKDTISGNVKFPSKLELENRRLVRMSLIQGLSTVLFIISWAVSWISMLLIKFAERTSNMSLFVLFSHLKLVFLIRPSLNPLLYVCLSSEFRTRVRLLGNRIHPS